MIAHRVQRSAPSSREAASYLGRRAAWVSLLPAALLVTWAYADAAHSVSSNEQLHFHLFWAGVLAFEVPASIRLLQERVATSERVALVGVLGLFATLPKVLRSPLAPIFHDEFAHWRQVDSIRESGALFAANPTVSIVKEFPGLHGMTALLELVTGTHSFALALIVVAGLHAAALLGVFVLATTIFESPRAGGIAAFVYAANPSYMYFDAQFAYETYAVVLFIWVLASAARAAHAADEKTRSAWLAIAGFLSLTCIATHHLTSYVLAQCLIIVVVVAAVRFVHRKERKSSLVVLAQLAAGVVIGVTAWLAFIAPGAIDYLSHSLGGGLSEIVDIALRRAQPKTLFHGSTTPHYERLAAFASPVLAFAAAAGAVWRYRTHPWRSSVGIGVGAYGVLYFAAVPLLLTSKGSEGASRTWAFTYVGMALIAASVLPAFLAMTTRAWKRGAIWILVTTSLGIVVVGNVATLISEDYRFPGPFIFGSDARATTPELVSMERWFRRMHGENRLIVTDRYTGLVMAGLGHDWTASPSDGFPVWQLFFNAHGPSAELLQQLRGSGWEYLIVDKRIYNSLPRVGVYFEPDEPVAYERTTPPPIAAYRRLFRQPWLLPVFQSTNYTVFRFNYPALGFVAQAAAPHSPA